MSLPSVNITIRNNGLAQVPPSAANASVTLGICSDGVVGQLYAFGDPGTASTLLGQGPLVENVADKLSVAGPGSLAMPLTPTNVGTLSAVDTTLVAGAGTLTVAAGPSKTIALKIITGGVLTTMTYSVSLNGGAYSAPILSSASAQLIAGTLSKVTFAAGTYITGDIYTFATNVSTAATLTGTGPAGSNVTQVSSPLDGYSVRVVVTTTGGLGAGIFTYTVDGGNNVSGQILIPSGGRYAIPNTGVVLVFSGTFTAADDYRFTTTTATFATSDVTAAVVALRALPNEWFMVHVVGMGADAAAAASMASTLDTQTTAAATEFRYVFGVVECPTSGSITSGGVSAQSDSTVAAAFASFSSERVAVCAGDVQHVSVLSGQMLRRNLGTVYTSRLCAIQPSEHPGHPAATGNLKKADLANTKSIYRDESATPTLDSNRFVTARTHIGVPGYFITRGRMMAAPGSDFESVMNRRVVDIACSVTRRTVLPILNQKVAVDKTTGFIHTLEADAIESTIKDALRAALVVRGDATNVDAAVKRDEPILTTKTMPITIGITPYGYPETINVTIGLRNPAAA